MHVDTGGVFTETIASTRPVSSESLLIGWFYICLIKSVIARKFKADKPICLHRENNTFVLRCFNERAKNDLCYCADFNYAE